MRPSTIRYFLKEGFSGLKKNLLMTVASIIAVAACISIMSFSYCVVSNLQYMLDQMEDSIGISVFLKGDLTSEDIENMKTTISGLDHVTNVTYISPADALDQLKDQWGADEDIFTACAELALHFLGIGPGDEVITSAYTYSASASVVCHVGAKLVLVDTAPDSYEMDYEKLEKAITDKTKVIIPVDIAGVMCDYRRIFEIVERKKGLFHPSNEIQEKFGRVIVLDDAAHAFGASRDGKMCGEVADFTSFSFHAVKNLTTAEARS